MAHPTSRAAPGRSDAAAEVGRPGGRRPLDASMTLLREAMERPLDPGYAAAAARRADGRRPGRRAVVVTLVLALVCGALLARSVLELRRPQAGATEARAALQAQVRARSAVLDTQQKELDRLRAQVAALQARALTGAGAAQLTEQTRLLELVAAQTPVTGPGLRITLADASSAPGDAGTDPRAGTTPDQGRVIDRDLQTVVNGLWAVGSEAIAVNGQRLTARSAIRFAGQAILVDFRPLVPPYVVDAVGDAAGLQTRFAAGSAGAYLQALRDNYGVQADIVPSAKLELPGAGGSATRFAHARAGADPSAPSSSSPSSSSSSSSPAPASRGAAPSPGAPAPSGGSSASTQPTPEVSP